ncbi:MAG: T9SS type A sorting domain-containing protein, partial [Bacteroidota bacterium]
NNLRVNHHAQLTVPQNKGITASANLVLKGGTNVVLDGGTGQFLRSSALIVDGTINYLGYSDVEDGHIEVHRTLYYEDSDVDYYHHQVAAPVSGAILGDWDMIHTNSYAYEFQSSSQTWYNIYNPARSTPSGYGFILSLFGIAGNTTEDVVFTDNLVEGSISPSVESGAGNVTLIGNPYTAPISWSSMITSQTGIVDNVKIWDPSAGNYKQFIATPPSGNFSCEYIQPGQAFFVEAIDGTASQFDMTPADRSQNIRPYLKSTRQNSLRMYTEGGNKTSDETYIVFSDDPNVTSGYDMNHDGTEWPSTYGAIATELYTTASDNVHLGIDARPLSPDLMSVPVHFKAGVVGEYNLVADLESIETFSQGTEIFLEDIMHPEQAWIDMREFNSYTFEGSPEDDYDRFMIHFHIKDFGISELGDKPVNIYSERTDAIIMNNSGQIIREIQVFDIAGNLMTVKTGITEDVTRMYVSDNTGYYVIKVITDKAVYADKVLISK